MSNISAKLASNLEVLQSLEVDPTCLTFIMHNEDHTLGNSLRYVIMKNPEVQFCGYTVPHPLENKIHLRIQTYGIPAQEALRRGLNDLQDLCAHVMRTFEEAVEEASSVPSSETFMSMDH